MKFRREIENLIASLRGVPQDRSRSIDRGTKGLDTLIEVCVERHQIGQETLHDRIVQRWPQLMGERWALRAHPERIDRKGYLVIAVANPVLRRELQFSEDRLMTALRSLPGGEAIQGLVFRSG